MLTHVCGLLPLWLTALIVRHVGHVSGRAEHPRRMRHIGFSIRAAGRLKISIAINLAIENLRLVWKQNKLKLQLCEMFIITG